MTTAFCDVMRSYRKVTYLQCIDELTRTMKGKGFKQRPQLTSSQQFGFDRIFTVKESIGNSNPWIGRIVNQRFKPNPTARPDDDPLALLLADLGLAPKIASAAAKVGLAVAGMLLGRRGD